MQIQKIKKYIFLEIRLSTSNFKSLLLGLLFIRKMEQIIIHNSMKICDLWVLLSVWIKFSDYNQPRRAD